MDAKEFYKDTYGEDAPNMFTTCMSKFVGLSGNYHSLI